MHVDVPKQCVKERQRHTFAVTRHVLLIYL
eukprot:SAG25_NODE_12736_length_276_cov_0.570621_1_plen_29_part_01